MRHCPRQLPFLYDRAAAEALDNTAGFFQQLRVCHPQAKIFGFLAFIVIDSLNLHIIILGRSSINGGEDLRLSSPDFLLHGDGKQLGVFRRLEQDAINAGICVGRQFPHGHIAGKVAL